MNAKKRMNNYSKLIIMALSIVLFTGCKTPTNITYFQDVNEEVLTLPDNTGLKIKPGDHLSIIVKAMDPNISALFNLDVVTDRVGESSSGPSGSGISKYTVSPEGTIDFPVLGLLKVAGMTRGELAGFIKGELMGKELAKDPIVTVEFTNMHITLLGDVMSPGRYELTQDKVSVIDAIGMAGDLNLTAQRENVVLIRESDGEVKNYKLDLTNFKELSQSPAYYVAQGDIIYVEPNDMRKRTATTNGNNVYSTGFWISVASLLTSVVTTVGVFVLK